MPGFDDLVARARALAEGADRAVLGITGAPGAGKTTLAVAVTRALRGDPAAPWAAHVPMDGFHLADVELERLDRLARKGAPDTFDARGYAALLGRLLGDGRHETVYAPAFDRTVEQPVAGSIPVPPSVRLVVTEGNYLLLDRPEWRAVRAHLAAVWTCAADDALRRERLVARHVEFGKAPDAARRWVDEVDEPNAQLIRASAGAADLRIPQATLDAVPRAEDGLRPSRA